MITRLQYTISKELLEQLKYEIPEFENRIDINEPAGDFFYDPWKVSDEFKNTPWAVALASLPFLVGEARLMKLQPGNAYYSHADADDRYHLNITGEKSFLVDLDNNVLHSVNNDGYWYEMDAGTRHSAVNFSNEVRIQLVVRKLLQKNNLTEPVSIRISLEESRHDYRYVFDDVYSPWINRHIKLGHVDKFFIKNEQVFFDIEKSFLGELESICPRGFKITICQ